MSQSNTTTQPSTPTQCDPMFTPGSVTLVLDAPRESTQTQPIPANYRTMYQIPNISGATASGSAEFSASQLEAMISVINTQAPKCSVTIVDLRQEPHGFLTIAQPLNNELEIAVGWFAERDWLNVAKDLPSIVADEDVRLAAASKTQSLTVYNVVTKSPAEDGICTATPCPVQPSAYQDEQTLVQSMKAGYLRLPTTDHCRPRDSEVDQFVAYEAALPANTWLHFHCRAGDGRTTTFMAMHDIINNAPTDSLATILARQVSIGGIDLSSMPTNQNVFSYPFSIERVSFIQDFYGYVCAVKSGGFKQTWSDWVTQKTTQAQTASA